MRLDLTRTQKKIQDTARKFAAAELAPVAAALDAGGERDIFLKNLRCMAQLGLMGINVSSCYGGSEAGVVAFSVAVTEIARACASTALTMSLNNMVCEVIQAVGSEDQKKKYIPKICSGEYHAAGFGLTEPEAGSDPAGMCCRAVQDGKEWVLNGSKAFISSGDYAGFFVIWALTDPSARKGRGISTFLVENGLNGFSIGKGEAKMGQNASSTNTLIFNDCKIPASALMGKLNEGYRTAVGELAGGRIGIGSLALGIGLAAIDFATKYALARKQFDQPLTNFQAIQWMIAESYTELEASRLLLMNAACCKEEGRPFARQASMAKYFATEAAEKACHNALQMLGGYGYMKEFPLERYARDVRVTSIYEGTNQIQRLVIAKDILCAAA